MRLTSNTPHHKHNVHIQKHERSPFALSAIENAQLEELHAKDRDIRRKAIAEEFHTSTRA